MSAGPHRYLATPIKWSLLISNEILVFFDDDPSLRSKFWEKSYKMRKTNTFDANGAPRSWISLKKITSLYEVEREKYTKNNQS